MHKLRNSIVIFAALLLSAPFAYAQSVGAPTSAVQFVVSPEVPGPNESVTIDAQGIGGFLGNASITWQVNGKTVLSGVGEHSLTFTTNGVGTATRVHVIINSSTYGTITNDFLFNPSVVHLLWEAHTTVPPLYRGKALYSAGSEIKVVALPQAAANGVAISPNALSYAWSVDGDPVVEQSGLGRSSITFTGSQLNSSERVSVDVSQGGTVVGSGSVVIPESDPEVVLYVDDPLRGVLYDQALPNSVSLSGQEITLKAEPYYFASESAAGSLSYIWKINGSTVTGPDSAQGLLTLRQTGSGQGTSLLSVDLQNLNSTQLVQAASAAIQIIFGQQTTGTSVFGS